MKKAWRKVRCWFRGHGDARIRKVNPVHRVTVYECRECGEIWAESDGGSE